MSDEESPAVGRSIQIERDAIGNTIISGDGNVVVIESTRLQAAEEPAPPSAADIGPNPYMGLLAFQETDADRFFGRKQQTARLWERLRDLHSHVSGKRPTRLLPVLGPSGSGKSSLVRAGLIAELARRPLPGMRRARVAVMAPGAHPVEALAAVLARIATNDRTPVAKTTEFEAALKQRNDDGECDGLRRIADALPDIAGSPLIVLVDQFEEIYSLCQDKSKRALFIDNLLLAARDAGGHLSVVITLRTDFLGETQTHEALNALICEHQVMIPAMNEEELRQAIARPAELAGHPLDEATITLLLNDTRDRDGVLPLLQFALTRIWDGLANGVEPAVTYGEIGGVGGALAGEAQRIYQSLNDQEKRIAKRVFLGLVQLGEGTRDTCRRANVNSLIGIADDPTHVEGVIRRFSAPDARLITLSADERGSVDSAEVTHEALFDHWRQLSRWVEDSRDDVRFKRRLDDVAVNWSEQGRAEGGLWRPPDLDLLRQFHERAAEDMTPLQMDFFAASSRAERKRLQAKLREERRLRRRTVIATSAAITAFVLLCVSIVFAVIARGSAADAEWESYKANLRAADSALLAEENSTTRDHKARSEAKDPLENVPEHQRGWEWRYLDNVVSKRRNSISDKEVTLWDTSTGTALKTLNYDRQAVSVAYSPDGRYVASGSIHRIGVWDLLKGGKEIWLAHEGEIRNVVFSPDGKLIASVGRDNGIVKLWRAVDYQPEPVNGQPSGNAISVAFSPNNTQIVVGDYYGAITLWDWKSGHKTSFVDEEVTVGEERAHNQMVFSLDFSSDGDIIASGSRDKTIKIWELTGQLSQTLEVEDGVNSVSFGLEGTIAAGLRDGTVRIWHDVSNAEDYRTLDGHEGEVFSVAFSPDGEYIASGAADKTVRIWTATGEPRATLSGHTKAVRAVAFSPEGEQIASASPDGTIKIWNAKTVDSIFMDSTSQLVDIDFAFSPDGAQFVSSMAHRTKREWKIGIWDATTGDEITPLGEYGNFCPKLAFSPDPAHRRFASADGSDIRLWDLDGKKLGTKGIATEVLCFSPDGKYLVLGVGATIQIWDAGLKSSRDTSSPGSGRVVSVAVSGTKIAAGTSDREIRIWDWDGATLEESTRLSGHTRAVGAVAFGPGDMLASGSDDGTVRIWDLASHEQRFLKDAHVRGVNTVAFSPDQMRLVSGGRDKMVRIWDTEHFDKLLTLRGHGAPVTRVAFSPDGSRIASASNDGTIRFWDGSALAEPNAGKDVSLIQEKGAGVSAGSSDAQADE